MTTAHPFGRIRDGRIVTRFTLRGAGGMRLEVLDYGAIVQALHVPDGQGRLGDVLLGYDDLTGYEQDRFYMGALIGRYANRIRGGTFLLDGRRYSLPLNNGSHHLHGGVRGFGKVVWRARPPTEDGMDEIVLEHHSKDGDEGYPGNLHVWITYAVSDSNVFSVDYHAVSDHPTPVNLTQHSYFNLAGEGSDDVLGHELTVHADSFTPLDDNMIPTGEVMPVDGTPLDFRAPQRIGARIEASHEQLRFAKGYDHTFVLDRSSSELAPAARFSDPASGRVLEVLTTEPGVHLDSGNFFDAKYPGKHGRRYQRHAGLALATQHLPDSPNQPGFPSTILRPRDEFYSRTEFRFTAEARQE